jgi:choline dehydrogenase-like flavoprotein
MGAASARSKPFSDYTATIAARLIEAMFPAGEVLAAPDPDALLAAVRGYLGRSALLSRGIAALLWWLELRCLLGSGRRFSRLGLEGRKAFLAGTAPTRIGGSLLRALCIPFKAAYLLDPENARRVQVRDHVEVPERLEPARWQRQVTDACGCEGDQKLEADVVVIGSGAGGAAAAYALASRGLAVVLLEEGRYHDRRDFNGKPLEVIPKLYRAMGTTVAFGNAVIPIPIGCSVGGTTTVNSGTCIRTPDQTLARWQREGLTELTREELEPYFQRVEAMLGVEPAAPEHVGEIGCVIRAGARALGMTRAHPLQRNARDCDAQGTCQFGCPTDAKRSTNVSFVPSALESGAFLFTGFRAKRLIRDGSSARGVEAVGVGRRGRPVELTVEARAVVVSMGALLTPLFLEANGLASGNLGANLTIHPAGLVAGRYRGRNFRNSYTIPQGYCVADLADEGLMFEGSTMPFLVHGLLDPLVAEEYVRFSERYQETAYFGFLVRDTSRGRVRRGLRRGLPAIRYSMNAADFSLFLKGIEILSRIHLKAGADEVWIPGTRTGHVVRDEAELECFLGQKRRPRDLMISAYHPLGTARIAACPGRGVCNVEHEVFGWKGLFIMDGSGVPGPVGANPQVTIMTLASRAAERLADRLMV